MVDFRITCCCIAALCALVVSAASEKQIKLEDIEKDTIQAAQQAKYEKQIQEQQQQQQQQQHPQYQQSAVQYVPQQGATYQSPPTPTSGVAYQTPAYVYQSPSVAYQTPSLTYQYVFPQQYLQPTVGDYASTASALQAYYSPQLTSVSPFSGFDATQQLATAQPYLFAYGTPQQNYYQGGLQYYPVSADSSLQYQYAPEAVTAQLPFTYSYPAPQQYVQSAQSLSKDASAYSQYPATTSQTAPVQTVSVQQQYATVQPQQTYSSAGYVKAPAQVYVTAKPPQQPQTQQQLLLQSQRQQVQYQVPKYQQQQQQYHQQFQQQQQQQIVAAQAQRQYVQPVSTTLSPLQTKYYNSPQYLAQNYNTIQTSHLYPKDYFSSAKSTASPPLKQSTSSGSSYLANNYPAASGNIQSYQPFRALPVKHF